MVVFLIVALFVVMCVLSSNSLLVLDSHLGTGSVDGPSFLMERVRGQHEHHYKQNNNKEENKGWFAVSHLQLLQPFAACSERLSLIPYRPASFAYLIELN